MEKFVDVDAEGAAVVPYHALEFSAVIDGSTSVSRGRLNRDIIVCCKAYPVTSIPHTEYCSNPSICEHIPCILESVRHWQQLRHKCIAQCFGMTMNPLRLQNVILVTEMASNTLERYVEKLGSISFRELVYIMKGVLVALIFLHKRDVPIPHRSLHPGNILVLETMKTVPQIKLTNPGGCFPSKCARGYMYRPPEDAPSTQADMYAFGALVADLTMSRLLNMDAGVIPLTNQTWTDTRTAFLADAVERLSRVSIPVSSLLQECCLHHPPDRIDAQTALFRLEMYTLPAPTRGVPLEEETLAVEAVVALGRIEGPAKRSAVRACLTKMQDYSASTRVLEAGCGALTDCANACVENRLTISETTAHITVISMMMLFLDNRPLQYQGCVTLRSFVGDNDMTSYAVKQMASIRHDGGIVVIMQALVHHITSALIAEHAVHVLCALARDANTKRIMLRYWGLQRIIEAMERHPKQVATHEYALRAICRLCDGFPKAMKTLVGLDGLENIYRSMDEHRDVGVIQLEGCRILELLTRPALGLWVVFHETTGIKRLYKAMDRHTTDEKLQGVCCQVLYNFTLNDEYKGVVVATEGLPRLYNAIRMHMLAREVLGAAVGALFNIATLPSAIDAILRTFGLAKLIAVMDAHKYREDLQEVCVGTLMRLAQDPKHRSKLAASDALPLTVGAMVRHPDCVIVQERCCEILSLLGEEPELLQHLFVAESVGALLAALSLHPNREPIQLLALTALWHVAELETAVEFLVRHGGVESVIKSMTAHAGSPKLQVMACNVLKRVCIKEEYCREVFNCGGITSAYATMLTYDALAVVQSAGCELLAGLAVVPMFAARIVQTEGLTRIHRAISRHANSRPVMESAVYVLSQLAIATEANAELMQAAGCIDRVFMVMDRWKSSPKIQARGLGFIYGMAQKRSVRSDLASRGAVERIHRTRVSNSSNDDVLEWAGRALKRMTSCLSCIVQ